MTNLSTRAEQAKPEETMHTPGPWVIGTETRGSEVCTIHGVPTQPTEDGTGQQWVYIHYPLVIDGDWHWPDEQEKFANARLIAAAPELLEALESMVREASMLLQNAEGCAANHYGEDFELHGEPQWITDSRARIVQARAAISKAIGQ